MEEIVNLRCLTVRQLIKELQISERSFYNLKKKHNKLPSIRVNEVDRYDFYEILSFLKKKGDK